MTHPLKTVTHSSHSWLISTFFSSVPRTPLRPSSLCFINDRHVGAAMLIGFEAAQSFARTTSETNLKIKRSEQERAHVVPETGDWQNTYSIGLRFGHIYRSFTIDHYNNRTHGTFTATDFTITSTKYLNNIRLATTDLLAHIKYQYTITRI